MSNYPNLLNQKSVSKTFNVGDEISNDGLLWFNDALRQVTERDEYADGLYVSKKFRITIEKV